MVLTGWGHLILVRWSGLVLVLALLVLFAADRVVLAPGPVPGGRASVVIGPAGHLAGRLARGHALRSAGDNVRHMLTGLGAGAVRVAIEAAAPFGWERYVGRRGARIGMTTFGSSAPLKDLQKKFGFTPDHVYAAAKDQIAQNKGAAR